MPHAATHADMLSVRTVAVALSVVEKTSTSLAASDMKSSTA
jgi:hypothetical protein